MPSLWLFFTWFIFITWEKDLILEVSVDEDMLVLDTYFRSLSLYSIFKFKCQPTERAPCVCAGCSASVLRSWILPSFSTRPASLPLYFSCLMKGNVLAPFHYHRTKTGHVNNPPPSRGLHRHWPLLRCLPINSHSRKNFKWFCDVKEAQENIVWCQIASIIESTQ